MIAKHRVDHIVLLTDSATTGTNAQFRVYLGCQRNIPGTVRTIAYIAANIERDRIGKDSQTFWVETHVVVISLSDYLHLFVD